MHFEDGKLIANNVGTTYITCKIDGHEAKLKVTVINGDDKAGTSNFENDNKNDKEKTNNEKEPLKPSNVEVEKESNLKFNVVNSVMMVLVISIMYFVVIR